MKRPGFLAEKSPVTSPGSSLAGPETLGPWCAEEEALQADPRRHIETVSYFR